MIQIGNGKIRQRLFNLSLCWHEKHKTESRLAHQEGTTFFLKSPLWISFVFMHFARLRVWHHSYALLKSCSKCACLLQLELEAFSSGIVFIQQPDECLSPHRFVFRFPKSSNGNTHRLGINQKMFWNSVQKWESCYKIPCTSNKRTSNTNQFDTCTWNPWLLNVSLETGR